jgi:hypothetical protein
LGLGRFDIEDPAGTPLAKYLQTAFFVQFIADCIAVVPPT